MKMCDDHTIEPLTEDVAWCPRCRSFVDLVNLNPIKITAFEAGLYGLADIITPEQREVLLY